MTATTQPPTTTLRRAATISRALKAEWTKFRTNRSTWRTIAAAVTMSVGLGAAAVASEVSQWDTMTASQRQQFDPTSASLIGLLFAAVILGSLAVRTVTAEYATGMIRITFAAFPTRRVVLAAKAATAAAIAFPVTFASNVASFEIGQRLLASKQVQASIKSPGALRAIVLGAVAASLIAVLGVGLGGLLRRTAAATTVLSLTLGGGAIFDNLLPVGFRQYLPSAGLQAVVTVRHTAGLLRPGAAAALLGVYALAVLEVANARVAHEDA